jgi:hypothetical protein
VLLADSTTALCEGAIIGIPTHTRRSRTPPAALPSFHWLRSSSFYPFPTAPTGAVCGLGRRSGENAID